MSLAQCNCCMYEYALSSLSQPAKCNILRKERRTRQALNSKRPLVCWLVRGLMVGWPWGRAREHTHRHKHTHITFNAYQNFDSISFHIIPDEKVWWIDSCVCALLTGYFYFWFYLNSMSVSVQKSQRLLYCCSTMHEIIIIIL